MKNEEPGTSTLSSPAVDSLAELSEALRYAQSLLARLQVLRSAADNNQVNITVVKRENEWLKKELSGLYELIDKKR